MKFAKQQRRQMRRGFLRLRESTAEAMPGWGRRLLGPGIDWLDMMLVDHGLFRLIYSNTHRVGDRVWRSSQPSPYQVRRFAEMGIRTIVNLRGKRECGAYRLEKAACERWGVAFEDFKIHSRAAPSVDIVRDAKALFDRIEYPALIHCKSGADRAGLASVLYLMLEEGRPVEEAQRQLDWRFGHFRQADTGILDAFFEAYRAESRDAPIGFSDWVGTRYDPEVLKRSFKAGSWANLLINRILRRE